MRTHKQTRIVALGSGHVVNDARVTQKQARSLARLGYDVTVFGCGGNDAVGNIGAKLVKARQEPATNLWNRVRALPTMYRMAVASNPDIVVCHEPESALAGVLVRARTGAKLHFDVHELYQESLSSRMPMWLRSGVRLLSIWLLKYLGRTADLVTVVSPANREFYLPLRKNGNVEIIHNSPRLEAFPCSRQHVEGPITLCHEGMLSVNRGFVQAMEALAIARSKVPLRLVFLGKVHKRYEEVFTCTVKRLKLTEAIEGPVWIDYSLLGRRLSQYQVGLVTMQPTPNNYLSLSNKLYNYMACGMPVIVPRGSASADLVAEYECGLIVDTTKPLEIAEAMVRLGSDERLRHVMGSNGRVAIERVLGWQRMEDLLQRLYAKLLEGNALKASSESASRAA